MEQIQSASSKRMYSLEYISVSDVNNLTDNESVEDYGEFCKWTDNIDDIVEYCLKNNPNDLEKLTKWKQYFISKQKNCIFPVNLSEFGEQKQRYDNVIICNPLCSSAWLRLQFAEICIYTVDVPDESQYIIGYTLNCSCFGKPFHVRKIETKLN